MSALSAAAEALQTAIKNVETLGGKYVRGVVEDGLYEFTNFVVQENGSGSYDLIHAF